MLTKHSEYCFGKAGKNNPYRGTTEINTSVFCRNHDNKSRKCSPLQ